MKTKKLFSRDLSMRSTFCKYDPDVTGNKPIVECDDCMVSLISDRFLGEKFSREILSKKYDKTKDLFTYVIIADTIGCNLSCWFCYAWKYLNINDAKTCNPNFLSAKELAKQFACKIRRTADINFLKKQVESKTFLSQREKDSATKHINKELPFSRIRISGVSRYFQIATVFKFRVKIKTILKQRLNTGLISLRN